MSIPLLPIALLGYVVGTLLASLGTVYRSPRAQRGASVAFLTTWVAHLVAVAAQGVQTGRIPLSNVAEFLIVVGFLVLTLHLYLWFRVKVQVAGLVLPPIAGAATAVGLRLLSGEVKPLPMEGAWFLFHVAASTLGMAILCVAFAMSVIYLIQDRALKSRKTLGLLQRLPSLSKCDSLGFNALTIGFLLLTLGIFTGVAVNAEIYQKLWVLGAKQLFPLLAWVVFAAILVARSGFGFRGRKSAYLTITGFGLVVLTVLGMNL